VSYATEPQTKAAASFEYFCVIEHRLIQTVILQARRERR